jgi:4,5-DOPA dioxygenase extradiol
MLQLPPTAALDKKSASRLGRRELLGSALALALAGSETDARATTAVPIVFLSHGAPLAGDPARAEEFRAWGKKLDKPRGILVMTPHFASRTLELGRVGRGVALYNLPGWMKRRMPQNLEYATPPSEALATRVEALLQGNHPVRRSESPGFDHTTWMPLSCLFPAADVPVLEVCYPYSKEAELFALGRALAPLRSEGIMVLGSGGMTHNLASIDFEHPNSGPPPRWSSDFDAWAAEALENGNIDALLDWRNKAPAATLAHPDDGGHFRVLLFVLGVAFAGKPATERVSFPITGFESTLSKRCVELF